MVVSPNFGFLAVHDPLLALHGTRAERYVFDDPAIALVKLRQLGELLAQQAAAYAGLVFPYELPQIDRLRRLQDANVVERDVADLFHALRRAGNRAVHEDRGDQRDAMMHLRMAFRLATWFHRAFADPAFVAPAFTPPTAPDAPATPPDLSAELAQAQAQIAAFAAHIATLEAAAAAAPKAALAAVIQQAQAAANHLELDEAETRALIDAQLRDAGWQADSATLTWASGARPAKGQHLAIAEVPTAKGPADYVLFVGLDALAIVEAKRTAKPIAGSIEQAKRYAAGFATTYGHVVPFLFATNGRAFLRQLLEYSGIWFLDARAATNHARPLNGWYSPAGLAGLVLQDAPAADARIAAEPTNYLGLRDYQNAAIHAVERAVAADSRHILLAMATGTGKTRTALGLIYRLVKSGRFRRVLFMVDRTALGDQTHGVFKDVKLENLQSFTDIYDVKGLGDLAPEPETRLHLATIQGMVKRVLFPSDDDAPPPIDAYDCVIIDECHRGYNLDRELSAAELTFRSEADYISKYRRVLDHFDATRIGLTATPALHTTEIFGAPVFQYGYRQAVVEGYLVDHRPPTRIHTTLSGSGIHWGVGEEVSIYDRGSGQLDLFTTPDEIDIELDGFNTKVITEAFNRVVCEQLAREIDPSLPGKTLIFCATDAHADTVVRLLKEAFDAAYGPVDDATVVKITGASDRPLDRIKHFKNERLPNVAVTVDLLTTGIDVPEIVNVVFMRRVKSRILYEQMLGRATRLCPTIGKDYFRIFDAVDLYAEMQAWSDMQPVVTTPNITFTQLARELAQEAHDDDNRQLIADQLRAKLHRKVRRMRPDHIESFAVVAGQSLGDFMAVVRSGDSAAIAALIAAHPALPGFLDDLSTGDGQAVYVSDHADAFAGTTTGYGAGLERPDDYLEGFRKYLADHHNDIAALIVVTQRPRDLTRKQLRELTFQLDAAGYSISALRTAWQQLTNQDIAASLIGFIRQKALGSPLLPYDERIAAALKRVLASHPWTAPQRTWLQRIAQQIKVEGVVDVEALDQGQFKTEGGFARLNKVFEGRLEHVLGELHDELWKDVG